MLPQRSTAVQPRGAGVPVPDILRRVCVRPPYFALQDLSLTGRSLEATARAEAPSFGEIGPITAADLGRHAAILGLTHVAASQRDDARRYYLAQRAECAYLAGGQTRGTPVRLASEVIEHTKRACRVHVEATAAGLPLASFDLWYAILPESAFCRLFRSRARETPSAPSPYGRLLQTEFDRGRDWAEQVVDPLSVSACVGHFDGYPALPVAVLMGQLSYLAGRLASDGAASYRVVRGSIDATDLAWAGERARFRVERDGVEGHRQRFACSVHAEDRRVGTMTLWLELVGEADAVG
jgi:hypothetical protein